jgi:hypothetical protein
LFELRQVEAFVHLSVPMFTVFQDF